MDVNHLNLCESLQTKFGHKLQIQNVRVYWYFDCKCAEHCLILILNCLPKLEACQWNSITMGFRLLAS